MAKFTSKDHKIVLEDIVEEIQDIVEESQDICTATTILIETLI